MEYQLNLVLETIYLLIFNEKLSVSDREFVWGKHRKIRLTIKNYGELISSENMPVLMLTYKERDVQTFSFYHRMFAVQRNLR